MLEMSSQKKSESERGKGSAMKTFPYSQLLLLVLSIALLVSIPAFRIIDLHINELQYDFFIYSPYSLYYIIAFCLIVTFLVYFIYRKNLLRNEVNRCILYLFLSIALFRLSLYIVNYPTIMFRDVYLHGAPTLATIETGEILYPTDLAPASFPLSFYYQAQFALITGITDVRLFNLPLQVVVYLCPILILYCSARRLSTNKSDLIISSIITVSLYPGVLSLHYARSFHALALLSIYMYMIAWPLSPKKANYAILLLLQVSMITLNPIIAIFPALMLGALTLLSILRSTKRGLLEISPSKQLVLYLILFLSWLTFVAITFFGRATEIFQAFISGAVWTPIVATASTEIGLSIYGALLKQSFKFFYIAIWLISLAVLLYKRNRPSLIYFSLALSLIPGTIVLASIDPEWDFMHKVWMTLPLCIGLLVPLGFRYLTKVAGVPKVIANLSHKKIKFVTGVSTLILFYVLLASSITLFEGNVYYNMITHDWLDAGHKHLATYYRRGGPIAIFDLNAMQYAYWHYAITPETQLPKMVDYRYVTPNDHLTTLSYPIRQIITGVQSSDIAVISNVDTYWMYSRVHANKSELPSLFSIVLSNNNPIYDNGYFIITENFQHPK